MNRFVEILLIILSAAAFGTLGILGRFAFAEGMDALSIMALRFSLAALVMLAVLGFRGERLPHGGTLLRLIGMGAVGYVGQAFAYLTALKIHVPRTGGAAAVPVPGLRGDPVGDLPSIGTVNRLKIFALGVAVLGLALTVGPEGGQLAGVLLAISAAAIYSVYIMVGTNVAKKSSSSRTSNLQGVVQVNGHEYASGVVQLQSTSYRTYVIGSWDNNPDTGADWSWNDIKTTGAADLEAFGLFATSGSGGNPASNNYATITRIRLIITAAMPSGGSFKLVVDTGTNDVRGILDNLSSDARFGLAYYNNSNQGGHIDTYVDFGAPTSMITSISNVVPGTWTPLAETLYEMIRYFRQDAPYYSNSPADYIVGKNYDPYYFQYSKLAGSGLADQYVPCAKSFVLMMTDGEPTQDLSIPATLQDYDDDHKDPGSFRAVVPIFSTTLPITDGRTITVTI